MFKLGSADYGDDYFIQRSTANTRFSQPGSEEAASVRIIYVMYFPM